MPKQLEHGQVGGLYFIASELVAGFNLHQILRSKKQLDERLGLKIIADALKGLSTMHAGGMVHRDVKPANILVLFDDENEWSEATYQSSKLTDFGLARFIDQSDSMEITRKLCIGTPLFQAPEQFTQSDTVSPSLDIYSIGITLYFLLAGKTPFENRDILYLAEQHRKVVPPKLLHVDSSISGATSSIVVKAIEKNPGMRYQDADSMLKDVERVLAGRPIKISSLSPKTNLVQDGVQNFTLQWELNCNIENIWPLVADTDRFNRAIKLPPVKFAFVGEGENRQLVASTCHKGMNLQWLEHPFEWVEGRELSVLREFIAGPFVWLLSRIELSKTDNDKTLLTHKLEVKPRGWLGKWFSWFQFKVISKRAIGKAYKKMEWIAQQGLDSSAWDSDFFSSPSLRQKNAEHVLNLLKQIRPKIKDEQLRLFADYLTTASDAAVTRIRPKYLAARLGCDLPEFLEFAFGCIQAGALAMMWDVICPVCRIASNTFNSIEEIKKHHRCEACNDSFPVDYARAVELVFRVHPDVRKADTRTYCIGGPFHLPHVVAQLTVGSSENYSVETQNHSPTKMLVRGPSIPNVHHLVQSNDGKVNRLAIELLTPSELPELKTGTLALQLENSSNEPFYSVGAISSKRSGYNSWRSLLVSFLPQPMPSRMFGPRTIGFKWFLYCFGNSLVRTQRVGP